LHAGLDLSRNRLDVCLLGDDGEHLDQLAVSPDVDSLKTLARRIAEVHRQPVCAVVESMTGARIVHDTLEQEGWSVEIADAQKVKGLAPLAVKTDRIDSRVPAVLSQRDLVPAIWLPDPEVREERELARFRLHLVEHKSALKNRIHSTLINFGRPCPVSDLFGLEGRELLARLDLPEPWLGNLNERPGDRLGARLHDRRRDRRDLSLPLTAEAHRLHRPLPRVVQSGESDRRGPLSKHGPTYLRWALLEATMQALKHPAYAERYQRNKRRLGKQRGAKVAQIDVARRLAHAIWHMLTRNQEFAPRGAAFRLAV
jgi:transposase